MKMIYYSLFLILLITISSCRSEEIILKEEETEETEIIVGEGLPDWTEETHGSSVSPDYSVAFNQNEVLRFDITISSDEWDLMQDDLDDILGSTGGGPGGPPGGGGITTGSDSDPIWIPCSVNFDDKEWYHVGIRYKGNSSLGSTYLLGLEKFSFKLDFDEFENDYPEIGDQRFYGFKQLNLKNNYDDASLMREKVGSDLFLDFGLAGPQTAFCVVYVDFGSGPVYFGVYTLVEEVDDTVLDNQFGESAGNLYKPDGTAASFASGTYNDSQMEKKNNEDLDDYLDVYDLYTIINSSDRTTDNDTWKTNLNSVLDVDVFLKWLAANITMQNWDTYGLMTHNYYLYNNTANGLLTWIPWDNNEALQEGKQGGARSMSLEDVDNSWPLIRYLANDDQYLERYKYYMLQFCEDVFDPESMTSLYGKYYDLLKEFAYAEISGYSFLRSDADFDAGVEELINHVSARNNAMESFLEL
jgi:spore coat protein H